MPWELAGNADLPSHIPSMQGFVVIRENNGGTPEQNMLTLDYSATEATKTVGKNTEIQRSGRIEQSYPHTIIDLKSEHAADRLWIFINSECKKGYDSGWDGRKFLAATGPSQIYTIEGEDNFQVSTMDDIHRTYLGVKAGEKDILHTLTFNHTDMDTEYHTIQLFDLIEGKIVDITESGSTYTFEVQDKEYTGIRFMISTESKTTTEVEDITEVDDKLEIYTQNNQIFIHNKTNNDGVASIYDMSGRCMLVKTFERNKITGIEAALPSGSYIVSLLMEQELINKPVIIK